MNDLALDKLGGLIRTHGRSLCDDPRRLRALLADVCPGMKREANALTTALEQRVVQDLLNASAGLPWEILAGRSVHRLMEEAAMAEDAAWWSVRAWGLALGRADVRTVAIPVVSATPPAPVSPRGEAAAAPAWLWHSGTNAHNFHEWLTQAQWPQHRHQADEALRNGWLRQWLTSLGDADSAARTSGTSSVAEVLSRVGGASPGFMAGKKGRWNAHFRRDDGPSPFIQPKPTPWK